MKMKRASIGILFIVLLSTMIGYVAQTAEGFVNSPFQAQRCGVGLQPCKGVGVRCMNGWCRSDRIH